MRVEPRGVDVAIHHCGITYVSGPKSARAGEAVLECDPDPVSMELAIMKREMPNFSKTKYLELREHEKVADGDYACRLLSGCLDCKSGFNKGPIVYSHLTPEESDEVSMLCRAIKYEMYPLSHGIVGITAAFRSGRRDTMARFPNYMEYYYRNLHAITEVSRLGFTTLSEFKRSCSLSIEDIQEKLQCSYEEAEYIKDNACRLLQDVYKCSDYRSHISAPLHAVFSDSDADVVEREWAHLDAGMDPLHFLRYTLYIILGYACIMMDSMAGKVYTFPIDGSLDDSIKSMYAHIKEAEEGVVEDDDGLLCVHTTPSGVIRALDDRIRSTRDLGDPNIAYLKRNILTRIHLLKEILRLDEDAYERPYLNSLVARLHDAGPLNRILDLLDEIILLGELKFPSDVYSISSVVHRDFEELSKWKKGDPVTVFSCPALQAGLRRIGKPDKLTLQGIHDVNALLLGANGVDLKHEEIEEDKSVKCPGGKIVSILLSSEPRNVRSMVHKSSIAFLIPKCMKKTMKLWRDDVEFLSVGTIKESILENQDVFNRVFQTTRGTVEAMIILRKAATSAIYYDMRIMALCSMGLSEQDAVDVDFFFTSSLYDHARVAFDQSILFA